MDTPSSPRPLSPIRPPQSSPYNLGLIDPVPVSQAVASRKYFSLSFALIPTEDDPTSFYVFLHGQRDYIGVISADNLLPYLAAVEAVHQEQLKNNRYVPPTPRAKGPPISLDLGDIDISL